MSAAGAEGADGGESDVTVSGEAGETVTVPPPDDEGGDERDTGAEQRPNRKERRANRMKEEQTARETAERAARESSERVARLERENAEIRGYLQAQAQQRQNGDPRAELESEVSRLEEQANGHLERAAMAAKAGDRETHNREMRAYNKSLRDAAKVELRAEMEPEIAERLQRVQGAIPSPEMMVTRDKLGQEFGWLYDDAEARAMTDEKIRQLAEQGRPMDYKTFREAAAYVGKRLGLGGRQAPTEQSRQRLQAVPGGEGAGGGDGSVRIQMTEQNKRLAHAAYKHLEPREAEREFAKMLADKARKGEWTPT